MRTYQDGAIFNKEVDKWLSVIYIYEFQELLRFIRVQDRTHSTPKIVLNESIPLRSLISTDSFSACNEFSMESSMHQVINQSWNFVDTETDAHTKGIERACLDAKSWFKRARSNRVNLQIHIGEAARSRLRASDEHNGT